MPEVARTAKQDKVRELQRTLYRAAKADPGRRFHALYDKVYRRDVLERAWESVRANRGAAGIDRQTIADVEQYGIARLLDELAADLKDGSYRPLAARRVFIPKPGSQTERRPLSIPAVRDRIVQAALKTVIEPIFEADFMPCSFGFRPRRSQHDALQVLIDEAWDGRRWVAESDISNCLERFRMTRLMAAIEERICDRHVLKLLRAMLRAGVMEDGAVDAGRDRNSAGRGDFAAACATSTYTGLTGSGQQRGQGVLVRFADDLLVMCRTRAGGRSGARVAAADPGASLGCSSRTPRRGSCTCKEGGEGVDFLGFHHRWVRATRARHVQFLARWPSRRAMQHARDRVREITARERLLLPSRRHRAGPQRVPARLGGLLPLRKLGPALQPDRAPRAQPARAVRGQTPPTVARLRLAVVAYRSPNRLGLISLAGTVVAPRPHRAWRGR